MVRRQSGGGDGLLYRHFSQFENWPRVALCDAGPGPKGSFISCTFQLDRQEFMALNGGPHFKFSPAISFFVNCQTQAEVDELWEKLSAGGKTNRCGWLDDKFGISWQIIPTALGQMLNDKDRAK